MKVKVSRKAHFNAAHRLYRPDWSFEKNDSIFDLMKSEIENAFDHKNLNVEVPEFKDLNPTAENIAVVIWNKLRPHIDADLEVKLYETSRNFPILKERLWGGTKLKDVLGKPIENDITGENENPEGVLGKSVVDRFGTDFPILIKFIDAKQDLSIQLHPNDALAKERHDSFGKTEMWYIMDADEDANLIV
ncbi:putative mannose-6-phosphate isomerase GmuF [Nymphon striatum]|nr:putative mannose-6-phosphate isomerase GmuF [Nymphon striatum]